MAPWRDCLFQLPYFTAKESDPESRHDLLKVTPWALSRDTHSVETHSSAMPLRRPQVASGHTLLLHPEYLTMALIEVHICGTLGDISRTGRSRGFSEQV